ncbi:hypothetical protein PI124_g19276 [Phytophthora idaei]|nr:hypothetical protein PI125_g20304 [Phytophthora idaei]KAG3135275.1 hypothetical protein PI126_g18320 [Phytophthora idaei]KAG3235694.1 hypothetical protein PI124_g19276 [Phytophthora idaei]
MESVGASEEDLAAEELALWNGMVHNSAPPEYQESTQINKLAGNDQQLWEDILHNSLLPDYADPFETQEGENAASADTHEEDARSDGEFQDEDKAEESDTDVDAGSEADEHDDGDIDYELENDELAEVTSHVSDLTPVPDDVESEPADYDYLFDPNDEQEAEYDSSEGDEIDDPLTPAGKGILAIPSQMLVGKVHPRDEEVRRTQDRKRTKCVL